MPPSRARVAFHCIRSLLTLPLEPPQGLEHLIESVDIAHCNNSHGNDP